MENNPEGKRVKKGFFVRWFEKLDKKIEAKAKAGSCCCKNDDQGEKKSCCS